LTQIGQLRIGALGSFKKNVTSIIESLKFPVVQEVRELVRNGAKF